MKNEKNSLVSLTDPQEHPWMASGEDYKVSTPKQGMEEGQNKLVEMSMEQEHPRSSEDGGMGSSRAGTPVGDRAAAISRNWKVSTADAEGTKMSDSNWVDLVTGQHSCDGPYLYKEGK